MEGEEKERVKLIEAISSESTYLHRSIQPEINHYYILSLTQNP